MEFTVEFYETTAGRRPVEEFLLKLKTSDPNDLIPQIPIFVTATHRGLTVYPSRFRALRIR